MPPPPILFAKDYGADVDPSRWVVIYPPYIDRLRTEAEVRFDQKLVEKIFYPSTSTNCLRDCTREQGRKISKAKCVEKPTAREVFDCCQMLNLQTAFEYNKAYSRDYLQRGRIRVKLFNDDKSPVREDIASRTLLLY